MALSDSCLHFSVSSSDAAAAFLKQLTTYASRLQKAAELYTDPSWGYGPEIQVLKRAAELLSTGPLDTDLCILVLKFAKWFELFQGWAGTREIDYHRYHTEMRDRKS